VVDPGGLKQILGSSELCLAGDEKKLVIGLTLEGNAEMLDAPTDSAVTAQLQLVPPVAFKGERLELGQKSCRHFSKRTRASATILSFPYLKVHDFEGNFRLVDCALPFCSQVDYMLKYSVDFMPLDANASVSRVSFVQKYTVHTFKWSRNMHQVTCCMEHKKTSSAVVIFQVQIQALLQLFSHLSQPIHYLQN
jgi:hypothetical protein